VSGKPKPETEPVEPGIIKFLDGRAKPYVAKYRDNAGMQKQKAFKLLREARAWRDEALAALVRGEYVDPVRGRITVGKWGEKWLAGRVDLKPKTVATYESLWNARIKPRWERVALDGVRHADIAAWVAKMRSSGLSASRTRQALHLFSAMLADAVKDRRLAANPATGAKLPRMTQKEPRYLTHNQLAEVADACVYTACSRSSWGTAGSDSVKPPRYASDASTFCAVGSTSRNR